jgi:uncharacterized membrane protein YeaQ/YmgE (transglycosylase-associated protein family)
MKEHLGLRWSRRMDPQLTLHDQQVLYTVQHWANDILVWIGFGTIVGLMAKGIMPGRDPGGALTTLALGVGGTVVGCGILSFFMEGQRVTPVTPAGFVVGTAGAFILLFFYEGAGHIRRRTRRLYRRPGSVVEEELV